METFSDETGIEDPPEAVFEFPRTEDEPRYLAGVERPVREEGENLKVLLGGEDGGAEADGAGESVSVTREEPNVRVAVGTDRGAAEGTVGGATGGDGPVVRGR